MPDAPERCFALIPAAGVGQRAGTGGPKQYAEVMGRPVIAHTLGALQAVPQLHATLVVLAPDDTLFETHVPAFTGARAWVARCGGATRAESVANGLAELQRRGVAEVDWVLVHDAARCLVRGPWIESLIDACRHDEVGGLLALPLADTLKQAHDSGRVARVAATVPRAGKWLAQTPQMFRLGLLSRALAAAGPAVTDESSAVEALGFAPRLVPGDAENIKLTWPADFALAARLLETRAP
jgi:2-C-methyl-D-erythritol 4-phosphate cytidylyltransferase